MLEEFGGDRSTDLIHFENFCQQVTTIEFPRNKENLPKFQGFYQPDSKHARGVISNHDVTISNKLKNKLKLEKRDRHKNEDCYVYL